jgi:hypothetical protein
MKKLQSFGTLLSKDQQKKISGGAQARVVCVCTGSQNHGAAYFCVGDGFKCGLDALQYCGGSMTCEANSGGATPL